VIFFLLFFLLRIVTPKSSRKVNFNSIDLLGVVVLMTLLAYIVTMVSPRLKVTIGHKALTQSVTLLVIACTSFPGKKGC